MKPLFLATNSTPPLAFLSCKLPRKILLIVLSCTFSFSVAAQKPQWTPVAELLIGSMGQKDVHKMSEVMHRCTALNMSLAALLAEDSPGRSQGFEAEALKMMQSGILIEMNLEKERTGEEPTFESQSSVAVMAVTKMLDTYNTWLGDNYDNNSGSYFNDDFETELKGCELASKLVGPMSGK